MSPLWQTGNYNSCYLRLANGMVQASVFWENGGYVVRINEIMLTKRSAAIAEAKDRAEKFIRRELEKAILQLDPPAEVKG